jgi:hypothetical protein
VVRVRRVSVPELPRQIDAQEGEDVVANHCEHLARGEVLESRPAEVGVGAVLGVLSVRENPTLH